MQIESLTAKVQTLLEHIQQLTATNTLRAERSSPPALATRPSTQDASTQPSYWFTRTTAQQTEQTSRLPTTATGTQTTATCSDRNAWIASYSSDKALPKLSTFVGDDDDD